METPTAEQWAAYNFITAITNRIDTAASFRGVSLELTKVNPDYMIENILPMLAENKQAEAKAFIIDHLTGMYKYRGIDLTQYSEGI